jgi:hypothetical protein
VVAAALLVPASVAAYIGISSMTHARSPVSQTAAAPPLTTPSAATSPSSAPNPTVDQATTASIALSAADLHSLSAHAPSASVPGAAASGWIMIANQAIALKSTTGCLRMPDIETAGWYREYSYDLQPNDAEAGHGFLDVYALKSTTLASQAQERVRTQAYANCYQQQSVIPDLTRIPGLHVTGPARQVSESLDAGIPAVMRLYTVPYTFAGSAKVNYDTVVWLEYGRYRAILDLWTCCGAPPVSDFQADAAQLAQRMKAAPA